MNKRTKRIITKEVTYLLAGFMCPKCNEPIKQVIELDKYPGLTGTQCDYCGEIFMLEYPDNVEVEPKVYTLETQAPVK